MIELLMAIVATAVAGTSFAQRAIAQQPIPAQSCTPLNVVDGQGTTVRKEVSIPGTLFSRDNWNTDFVVPSNSPFRSYTATITAEDSGEYDLTMNLKYPDTTSDTVYRGRNVPLDAEQVFRFSGYPRANQTPFQVNVVVGGASAARKDYLLEVLGCF